MAEEILLKNPHEIAEFTLVPSKGGVFEVAVDGRLIYSKKQTGRHARPGEISQLLDDLMARL